MVASEAKQCPTILLNGFGGHRIEGIGDKHVPWIHNVKNTDAIVAIDDEDCMRIFRLFNEPEGIKYLIESGVPSEIANNLNLLGISGISNMLSAIKTAKFYEMNSDDVIITVATDSSEMYSSRLDELRDVRGTYSQTQAVKDFEKCVLATTTDWMKELTYYDRKAIHNLKYFTWVEQQGKEIDDLNRLWYDREIWPKLFSQSTRWDELIEDFNERVGLLKSM